MSEHRREGDKESWLSKNGLTLLAMIGTLIGTVVVASMFFGRTVEKVNAYEPRICKGETAYNCMNELSGKMDMVILMLDPSGEKRKRIGK